MLHLFVFGCTLYLLLKDLSYVTLQFALKCKGLPCSSHCRRLQCDSFCRSSHAIPSTNDCFIQHVIALFTLLKLYFANSTQRCPLHSLLDDLPYAFRLKVALYMLFKICLVLLHVLLYNVRIYIVLATIANYIAIPSADDCIAIPSIVDCIVIPSAEDCFMMRLLASSILINVLPGTCYSKICSTNITQQLVLYM